MEEGPSTGYVCALGAVPFNSDTSSLPPPLPASSSHCCEGVACTHKEGWMWPQLRLLPFVLIVINMIYFIDREPVMVCAGCQGAAPTFPVTYLSVGTIECRLEGKGTAWSLLPPVSLYL